MKFRPLQDRILIKRVDSEVKTAGGIIIPNSAQEKPQEGSEVKIDGEDHLILREDEILGVMEN